MGSSLAAHFRIEPADWARSTARRRDEGQAVRLFTTDKAIQLGGSALMVDGGVLLALNLMPGIATLENGDVTISDFSPADPSVPALMLVALQQQMLDDAHRTAEELDRERSRSAQLWQRISRVAGHMAHDFANVFSIIMLNARRLASEGRLSADDRRLARIIEKTVERGTGATHSLMTMAQQQHDSPAPVAVDRILRDSRHFLSTLAGPAVALSLDLHSRDAVCTVSRSGLIHALVDLVVQARDAMPTGGGITICSSLCDDDASGKPMLEVRVESYPADPRNGASAGSGTPSLGPLPHQDNSEAGLMGLEEFVRGSGGTFAHGQDLSTCAFRLPVSAPPRAADANAAIDATGPAVTGRKLRVLVVEDEPFALEAITELLVEDGLDVTPCATFDAALAAVAEAPFDVVLSDVVLPSGNGIDLCHRISDLCPGVRIVLMSGYILGMFEVGVGWCFLRKPVDVGLLRRLVLG